MDGAMTHGITTMKFHVGLSAVATVSLAPNVIMTHIRHTAGGTLYMGAQGTAHATLLDSGAVLQGPTNSLYEDIYGPAGLAFAAGGATCTVSIIRALGQGYVGQY